MKYEVVRFEKTFQHSPKASKHQLYIVFNVLKVDISHLKKKVSKVNFDICYPMKKYAEFESEVRFA